MTESITAPHRASIAAIKCARSCARIRAIRVEYMMVNIIISIVVVVVVVTSVRCGKVVAVLERSTLRESVEVCTKRARGCQRAVNTN